MIRIVSNCPPLLLKSNYNNLMKRIFCWPCRKFIIRLEVFAYILLCITIAFTMLRALAMIVLCGSIAIWR